MSTATVGIRALLDLDTRGEVVETLLYMLTEPTDVEPDGLYYPALALLVPAAINDGDTAVLRTLVGLCPIHGCDIEICADDDNPECRALTGRGRDPEDGT